MIFILAFSGSIGIKLTYSAGILIGIQNLSCVPFLHGVRKAQPADKKKSEWRLVLLLTMFHKFLPFPLH